MSKTIKAFVNNLGERALRLLTKGKGKKTDRIEEFLSKYPEFLNIHDNQYIIVRVTSAGSIYEFDQYLNKSIKKRDFIMGMDALYPLEKRHTFKITKLTRYMSDSGQMYECEEKDFILVPTVKAVYFPETDEWYYVSDGMTKEEREINEYSVRITNLIAIMPVHHINHRNEICKAMTEVQHVLQSRTCHRLFPDTYPIKNGKVDK